MYRPFSGRNCQTNPGVEIGKVGEAMTELKKLKNDDNFIEEYWLHQKAIDNYNSAMSLAIRRGREEGREEGKIETALAMLKKGLSQNIVAECTGLSEEEIARLAQKLD
ncbi:MAG: Rpn family recombination-promoting nuclease/putative transposase [Rickettsiales bacterium]|jgi:predicted transposase/invertase (TIGR01784 family)|nr:Rpn family recombination-promoting nuclease/putative transposase [Rickettsiales bacterium]